MLEYKEFQERQIGVGEKIIQKVYVIDVYYAKQACEWSVKHYHQMKCEVPDELWSSGRKWWGKLIIGEQMRETWVESVWRCYVNYQTTEQNVRCWVMEVFRLYGCGGWMFGEYEIWNFAELKECITVNKWLSRELCAMCIGINDVSRYLYGFEKIFLTLRWNRRAWW